MVVRNCRKTMMRPIVQVRPNIIGTRIVTITETEFVSRILDGGLTTGWHQPPRIEEKLTR